MGCSCRSAFAMLTPRTPGGLGRSSDTQSLCNFADDLLRLAADVDDDWIFVWRGFVEDRELAVEQGGWHEVTVALGQALADEVGRSPEVDQPYIGPIADDDVAIRRLQ